MKPTEEGCLRIFLNPEPDIFKRLVNRGNAEEYIIIPYFSLRNKVPPLLLNISLWKHSANQIAAASLNMHGIC
jgi:hypothetical protein